MLRYLITILILSGALLFYETPKQASANQTSGSVLIQNSAVPSLFKSGVGLLCLSTNSNRRDDFFLLTSEKTVIGRAQFSGDKVTYYSMPVDVSPTKLKWANSWVLNRQTLFLNSIRGIEQKFECVIKKPNEIHELAQEALQQTLNKNKL